MALKSFQLLSFIFLVFLAFSAIGHAKRDIPSNKNPSAFEFIKQLQGWGKGYKSQNIYQLKNYLQKFGYLNHNQANNDIFDDDLESAIKIYQQNFHIKATGKLDAPTISTMMTPRCGAPDIVNGTNHMRSNRKSHDSSSHNFHIVSHYRFYDQKPKWPDSKTHLTYRFSDGFPGAAINPVKRAFQRWASMTQYFTFSQVKTDEVSDLIIGYYQGEHGDGGKPFDGPDGTLAHSFPPDDGRFHLDADERWSIGVGPIAGFYDLESVAVHEIGHLLGLEHSQVKDSIMYPTIGTGMIKRNFHSDDIQGFRALYNN